MIIKGIAITFISFFAFIAVSKAQRDFYIRPSISIHGDAGNYGINNYPVNNPYYHFRKIPISSNLFTSFNSLPFIVYQLDIETRLNFKTLCSFGITLNDDVSSEFKVGIQTFGRGANIGYKKIFGYFTGARLGINVIRFPLTISYEIYSSKKKEAINNTKSETTLNKKIFTTIELTGGLSYIRMRSGNPYKDLKDGLGIGAVDLDSNYVFIGTGLYNLNKCWGFTLNGGFNIKLKNVKKELVCIRLQYEQGFRNMIELRSDIYFDSKKLHFHEQIYSRGSRITLSVSVPFNASKLLRKI